MKGLIDMLPMKKFGNKDVVDWKAITKGFEFTINETRCEIVSNENVTKVSRNGKTRKERRLTVRPIGYEATLEVSATSFKNMSFGKRLAKAMDEAPKAQPKAKKTGRTYKKEAKRDLPCGLTEAQCKTYIKKYGYAWVNTPEGTFTAPEYEAMKAKEEAKRQEEVEAELRRYEQEQRDMVLDNIFEKILPMCQGWFEEFTDINDFNNINVLGGIRWETPQELIDRVSRVMKRIVKENKGDDFQEITLAVWYLFYQDKYEAWVHNNWDKLWNITRNQWEQWQNEHFGESWKERWEWQNECAFDIEATEFDVEFVGLTSVKEVKRVYRRLAKQYHPDMGGDAEKMKELTKAYEKALRNVDRNEEPTLEQLLDELLAEVEAELKGAFLLA